MLQENNQILVTEIKTLDYNDLSEIDLFFVNQLPTFTALSTADKKKVGCIIANTEKQQIISMGFNKMFDNLPSQDCEDINGQTIPYVTHAEENAVFTYLKTSRRLVKNSDLDDLTCYVSYAPCHNCAKMIAHIGIKRIVYIEKHDTKFHIGQYSPAAFCHRMNIEVLEITNTPDKLNIFKG